MPFESIKILKLLGIKPKTNYFWLYTPSVGNIGIPLSEKNSSSNRETVTHSKSDRNAF